MRREIIDQEMNSCSDCTWPQSVVYFSLNQNDPKEREDKSADFISQGHGNVLLVQVQILQLAVMQAKT